MSRNGSFSTAVVLTGVQLPKPGLNLSSWIERKHSGSVE